MAWLAANWFSALIFFAFIAMHLFGHGGHGGHGAAGRPQTGNDRAQDDPQERGGNSSAGGHQH